MNLNSTQNNSRHNPVLVWTLSFVSIFLIMILDYTTGTEISFSIFYLIPITTAAWYLNFASGIFFAVFSAVCWFLADKIGGRVYSSLFIPYWNALVRLCFFLITLIILTKLRKAYNQLNEMARIDLLTGIPNSRYLSELFDREVARAHRYKYPLTVAYIDVDDFKLINDNYGHETGDKTLRLVAEILRKNIRVSDVVGRIGGDEFVLILPHTGEADAAATLEKLRSAFCDSIKKSNLPITLSIGAACFEVPPSNKEEIIKQADTLMYNVKSSGKNAVKIVGIPKQ